MEALKDFKQRRNVIVMIILVSVLRIDYIEARVEAKTGEEAITVVYSSKI